MKDNAKNKIWALEGYLLKQKLYEEPTDFKGRLLKEREDLENKINDLGIMLNKGKPDFIDAKHWNIMVNQHVYMVSYHEMLTKRIELLS